MGLFDKLFKKQPDPDPVKKEKPADTPPPAPEVKKRTSWLDELADPDSPLHEKLKKQVEPPTSKTKPEPQIESIVAVECKGEKSEPMCELSHLDFGKPAGVIGCFLNYETGCLIPPTDRVIELIRKNGIEPPDGLTKEDANCILRRIEHDYNREGPEPWLVSLATEAGTKFSAYIGGYDLCKELIYQLSDKNRAALYAYAVYRGIDDGHMDKIAFAFGKMKKDSELSRFYDFADQVIASPSLLKSLKDREIHDFQHPHKGTSIYKAAAQFFGGGA